MQKLRFAGLAITLSAAAFAACTAEPAATKEPDTNATADALDAIDPDSLDGADPADAAKCSPSIAPLRELEIVDPSVVGDSRALNVKKKNPDGTTVAGHWSFRFLVEQMAPTGVDPSDFVLAALQTWDTDQTVNGFSVPNRKSGIDAVINAWKKRPADGKLDLEQSPFRLEAIVYRPDLGSGCNAGEGRFVFGLTAGAGDDPRSRAELMTVIFEYHLPIATPHQWARRFHHLNSPVGDAGIPPIDSETYRGILQGVTDKFAKRGSLPGAPNDNAISQVRTNEIQLGNPWQLREFHLVANGAGQGFLVTSSTAQAPDQSLNNTGKLHDFILDNKDAINGGTILMPQTILGGQSDETTGFPSFAWMTNDQGTKKHPELIDATTKLAFSMLTCNGCHHESQITKSGFYHVSPVDDPGPDGSGKLSTFLLGDGRNPGDLARRATIETSDLCTVSCAARTQADPARVH
ncbi:MAG TPA: hypothetical protein VIF62_03950 [Labilithrix sp.]|jgi:hypothetical protein